MKFTTVTSLDYRTMIHFALALTKASHPASRDASFLFFLLMKASFQRSKTKKPSRLRLIGLVTPSGFKPETF
jgi:hypothetical protein